MPKVVQQTAAPTSKANGKPSGKVALDGGVLSRIRPLGFDEDDGINILLYGRSGTGKTTLWGSFPKPILSMICSGGTRPGELRSLDTPAMRKVVKTINLESTFDIDELGDYIVSDDNEFQTIVLDHATGLQDMIVKEMLGLEQNAMRPTGWGAVSQQQWGFVSMRFKELLFKLLGFRGNVVVIAQEREMKAEEGSELSKPFYTSALTPAISGWLNAAVDYVAQTYIRAKEITQTTEVDGEKIVSRVRTRDMEYCLRTGPSDTYSTKFRVPKGTSQIQECIIDPSYETIMELIRGRRK